MEAYFHLASVNHNYDIKSQNCNILSYKYEKEVKIIT